MGVLRVGSSIAEVDDGLLQLASSCCYLDRFRIGDSLTAPSLRVRRVEKLESSAATPLDGVKPDAGTYSVSGNEIAVQIPPAPGAAEASLRALFQVATIRQGGLLIHASGVAFEGKAVIAIGESGAGKSTLARLCVAAGGTLLSDETIGLHPDMTAWGSPFFSEPDLPSQLTRASLVAVLTLDKGQEERIYPMDASEATAALLAQAYRPAPGETTPAELLARAGALALQPGVRRLTFRNNPGAGLFVKRWIVGETG